MKKWIIAVFAVLSAFSCALTPVTIRENCLSYLDRKTGAEKYRVHLNVSASNSVYYDDVSVGVKKNGYGWEMARIYIDPSIKLWVAGNLARAFQDAGFTLVEKEEEADVKVQANVDFLFVEPDVQLLTYSLVGSCKMSVTLNLPEKNRTFRKKFVGLEENVSITAFDSDFQKQLFGAVRMVFWQIVNDTWTLLESEDKK